MTPDLIKRFTPTSYDATLPLHNTVLRVSTNQPLVLDRLRSVSSGLREETRDEPSMSWRIVVEENVDLVIGDKAVHHFSNDGLAFIRIGNRGFLACDRRARFGISFLAQEIVENEHRFNHDYLPALLLMLQEMESSA